MVAAPRWRTSRPGWEGARNLADLGGLPVGDGTTTAYGVVWRAAAPEWLTDRGWQEALTDGLARIVDLRNDVERRRHDEHPRIAADAAADIEVVHAPVEDPDDAEFLAEAGPWLDHPAAWEPTMRRFGPLVARALVAVAEAPGPVLVHCAGGRDRTGLVTSLLLHLAGVTPEGIAANYADGFRGGNVHRGHGYALDAATGVFVDVEHLPWSEAAIEDALAVRVPAVHAWVAATDPAAFLTRNGVTPDRVALLRALLRTD